MNIGDSLSILCTKIYW